MPAIGVFAVRVAIGPPMRSMKMFRAVSSLTLERLIRENVMPLMPLGFLLERGRVVGQHAAGAQAIEHGGSAESSASMKALAMRTQSS